MNQGFNFLGSGFNNIDSVRAPINLEEQVNPSILNLGLNRKRFICFQAMSIINLQIFRQNLSSLW